MSDDRSPVERVLDSALAYDDLEGEEDQSRVQQVQDERIRAHTSALNFESEFIAQGPAWTDVDADGSPVRRNPGSEGV